MKTLFSFLLTFSFTISLFAQTRTSPVISSNTDANNLPTAAWKVINVTKKKITISIKKSIDCAKLTTITAKTSEGNNVIIQSMSDLNILNTTKAEYITITFKDNVVGKRIILRLDWNLSDCSNVAGSGLASPNEAKKSKNIEEKDKNVRQTPKAINQAKPKPKYSNVDAIYLQVEESTYKPVKPIDKFVKPKN